jgi:predicted ATPase/class 3 adenylate cyclase
MAAMTSAQGNRCPKCQFDNPPGFKFCGQCGTPLEVTPAARAQTVVAERRQLTVMFCDLVGSTSLADRLDPEELRDVVREFQRASSSVVDRYGGYIAQYLGDGLLVYFGFPLAQEDAPRRAAHAGLGIVEAVSRLSDQFHRDRGFQLAVRVGIHTGEVVTGEVGEGASQEHLAMGQTPNVAARLQAEADPNTVVLSDATYRLVRGVFNAESKGSQVLKGISRPVELFRIVDTTATPSGPGAVHAASLSPLVGRERELGILVDRFDQAGGGSGQVVLLEAPPGVGKSRLVQAFRDSVATHQPSWWSSGCSAYATDTALFPIIEVLERTIGIQRADSAPDKLEKLKAWLAVSEHPEHETLPALAHLLSIPVPDRDEAFRTTPQREKARILEVLLSILRKDGGRRVVVFAVEDLHWVDPSTLEFLNLLLEHAPQLRLLLLLTFRPTFAAPWSPRAWMETVKLDRLPDEHVERLAHEVAGGALPREVLAEIVQRTDGVPLFVEELTRMVVESDRLQVDDEGRYRLTKPLAGLEIPVTLQDSLMARLDRLTDLKELAQLASVLGRDFSFEMLREVYPSLTGVDTRLDRLVEAGLLFQHGQRPEARYTFRHALIQDAAYGSLLKSARRQHHAQVARTLEERYPTLLSTRPELAAHHFTEAGLDDLATTYWYRAGELAFSRSANVEAITHLNKALALVARLPESPGRDQLELSLQTVLGPVLNTTRGYASPDVERTFARARELCERLGSPPELFWIARGQWAFYVVRGDLAKSLEIGEQLQRSATALDDPILRAEASYTVGNSKFFLSQLAEAHTQMELTIQPATLKDRTSLRYTGQHTGVMSLAIQGWLRWVQGYPDQALRYSERAIALAEEINHPLSATMALFFSVWVHQLRGNLPAVRASAREVISRSREQGLFYELLGNLFIGWAMAAEESATPGDVEQGVQMMRQCLDMNRASGARLAHTFYLSMLMDIYVQQRRREEARRVFDEGLATAADTGERFWLAELNRLEGELELAGVDKHALARAERAFRRALDIATVQGSRSLQLRAAMSLGRLISASGQREEAHQILSTALAGFTEGFDTPNLRDARMLLDVWG